MSAVSLNARIIDRKPARRPVDKFNQRRRELADATLRTLSELGYARTSLREIAQNSQFSHGVLHYYFTDKVDLIVCGVRQYKAGCTTRYDDVIANATTVDALAEGFIAGLSKTLVEDAPMHRLWFDLRSQALFDEAFRGDVLEIDQGLGDMIVRVTRRLRELAGAPEMLPDADMYPLYDGLFQRALLRHLAGDAGAIIEMQIGVRRLLNLSLGRAGSPGNA